MASSFLGLYVQRDALQISQKALDITGNNISNINTVGYTRQRVDICSVAHLGKSLGYKTAVSLAGTGAEAIGVSQIRDRVRDKQVRDYSADLCDIGVKTSVLSNVEDIFDSIESDSGYIEASYAAIVNKLEAALQSFSADDADRAEIANVALKAAESLTESINNSNLKLNDIASATCDDAKATVKKINTILSRMGVLNEQIKNSYIAMGYLTRTQGTYQVMSDYGPLELKDEMNNLLDELSQYGNINFKEEADGTFTVKFANQLVVEDKKYAQVAITEVSPRSTELSYVITQEHRDTEGNIDGGLYDSDTWYDMNVDKSTGGDSQKLIREFAKDLGIKTINITGKRPDGSYYLDSGSLRGFLDVYNGRGQFADDVDDLGSGTFQVVKNQLKYAQEALDVLSDPDAHTAEELKAAVSDIKICLGADVERNEDTGDYKVTVNNIVLLDTENGVGPKELTTEEKMDSHGRPLGDITISADGEEFRTITVNSYAGVEYYRDMLNAFVKTIHDEFNSVYKGINVKNDDYDPDDVNSEEYTVKDYKLFEYDERFFRNAAENMRVSDDWLNKPLLIANPTNDNKYEELDNIYINKLLGIMASYQSYKDDFGHYAAKVSDKLNIETFVSHICNTLGTQVDQSNALYKTTDIMLTMIEEERSGVMDVAMNEEGINMMNYQKWYNAISRMISTLDEALDKLINNTGIVGLR